MTLHNALRKAFAILGKEKRGVVIATSQCQYRLAPSDPRSAYTYQITRSVRYNDQWQPWSEANGFDVDDVLTDKWSVH